MNNIYIDENLTDYTDEEIAEAVEAAWDRGDDGMVDNRSGQDHEGETAWYMQVKIDDDYITVCFPEVADPTEAAEAAAEMGDYSGMYDWDHVLAATQR